MAVSATIRIGASAATSTNDRTCAANAGSRSTTLDASRVFGPLEQTAGDHRLDLREPGVLADRRRPRPAQLDAVVLGRVVAGGDHRRGCVEMARGEVAEVGGREPEVERRRRRRSWRLLVNAATSGSDDGRASWPTRMRAAPVNATSALPDPARDRLVELVGVDAANVVGLEDDVERSVGHREPRVLTARSGTEIVPGGASGLRPESGSGHSPPDEAPEPDQAGERPDPAQPLGGGRAVGEAHVPARRHDDHEVGRRPPRARRPRRPPSSGSTRSSPSPGPRCATRRTRSSRRSLRTFETFTSGSGFFAT